jgi:hypothetical protein
LPISSHARACPVCAVFLSACEKVRVLRVERSISTAPRLPARSERSIWRVPDAVVSAAMCSRGAGMSIAVFPSSAIVKVTRFGPGGGKGGAPVVAAWCAGSSSLSQLAVSRGTTRRSVSPHTSRTTTNGPRLTLELLRHDLSRFSFWAIFLHAHRSRAPISVASGSDHARSRKPRKCACLRRWSRTYVRAWSEQNPSICEGAP